jgi:Protein of unknown function (DUF3987)
VGPGSSGGPGIPPYSRSVPILHQHHLMQRSSRHGSGLGSNRIQDSAFHAIAESVETATSGGAGDDGFLQRVQYSVWPDVAREWEEIDRQTDVPAERQVENVVDRVLALSPEDPLRTRFSAEAQERFGAWRRELEHRIRSGALSPAMHLAKARSLLPKLALIFHLAESDLPDGEITLLQWVAGNGVARKRNAASRAGPHSAVNCGL